MTAKKLSKVKFRIKRWWVGMTQTQKQLTTRGETKFMFNKLSFTITEARANAACESVSVI